MAIAVQANIAIAWPSASAVPTGWQRVSELDSVYIVGAAAGAATDLTTARGNTTHLHTSPAHTPTQDAHSHTGTSSNPSNTTRRPVSGTPNNTYAIGGHIHTFATSSDTATNVSVAITIDATTNDLAHTKVVWIKSLGTAPSFPATSVVFWDTDSFPAGWSRTLAGTYIKGATTGSGGGTTAGANTHTHTSPAHTHTQNAHNHTTPLTSSVPDISSLFNTTPARLGTTELHTHSVAITAFTSVNNATTTTLSTDNHEPVFKYINALTCASNDYPIGAIALWLGTDALIPTGWTRVSSLDTYWVKSTSADGQVLTTGGATTHTHTASTCQPTQNAHSHVYTNTGLTGTRALKTGTLTIPDELHTHTWTEDAPVTATNQAASVTIDVCAAGDAYPPYRTVIFVKLVAPQDSSPVVIGPTWSHDWRVGFREDVHTQDLTKAAYRQRRRGEG